MLQSTLTDDEIYLFHQGTNYESYRLLGAHVVSSEEQTGCRFTVWAPHARTVRVVGDFNDWSGDGWEMEKVSSAGLWTLFIPHLPERSRYKYDIEHESGQRLLKADPYATQAEVRPNTASLTPLSSPYEWQDALWQAEKKTYQPYSSPLLIYEVHLGSWKKKEDGSLLSYRELADELIPYVTSLGYTHIELLPVCEHPFDLSWGYQITGYYAPTSRHGNSEDFKYFVDCCHQKGIGVILDWVPGHFCRDDHGLRQFDGEALYEYSDERKADKPTWGTLTFDFGRPEVQSFLISNAVYWLKEFHLDGLRVDAVASMLYLNFDRNDEKSPIYNTYGGEENLEALAFLKKMNEVVFHYEPNALMMAEDSSDWPKVTGPTDTGGLGFNFKWDMGWMNDMLAYMELDPIYRKYHHNALTFSHMYADSENFVLPLSHDEVVHGKKSLLDKMPGDQWQQFAQWRLLYGYMLTHPGKKLLFMGGELAQYAEWKDQEELDWHLLEYPLHHSMQKYVGALNHFYLEHPELYEADHEPDGFHWIDPDHHEGSVISFRRVSPQSGRELIIVCHFTPAVLYDYKIGVPEAGTYQEIFNSDASDFGGSNQLNENQHFTIPESWHGYDQHIRIKVPPFALSIFERLDV
ncbi:1,4-alpha-glucan branching protein GlgB [Salsuginibacillus kocurii]|uniref:1,4-alpha-glucan branching protein GlgB n=1 Tax=Salsuginibacillus kocurii TaxID=427078 RepID=UPI0003745BD4|nr:1,4-alpha-glucan branching protein GlgB [Salsuginibacillus kocurii]